MKNDTHKEIREKLINKLILIMSVIVVPAFIFSMLRVKQIGWQSLFYIHIFVALSAIIFSIIRKSISYNIKVSYIIIFYIALAISASIYLELSGFFIEFLMLTVLMGIIFWSRRHAIFLTAIGAIIIILIGFLIIRWKIDSVINLNNYAKLNTTWINVLSAFLFLSAFVIIVTGDIGNLLSKKISELQKTTLELNKIKKKLDIQNKELVTKNIELTELNATKNRFFRIIGHDLKSPISQMIQLSQLLEDNCSELQEENTKILIKAIKESSVQGFTLLDNLLEWARSQTNEIKFNPETVSLFNLLNENKDLLIGHAKIKGVDIIINVDKNIEIRVDINMMNTVFRNLLSNAIKFTYSKGKIEIDAIHKLNNYEISFTDTGIGMTKEEMEQLFRIDTDFSAMGTNSEKGTGIGLILCQEFIHKHGGKIYVESEKDIGSKFIVSLPAELTEDGSEPNNM